VRAVAILVLALAVDVLFGDARGRWHPVAWMGALLTRGRGRLAREHVGPVGLLVSGAVLTLSVASLAAGAAAAVSWTMRDVGLLGIVVEAVALKQTLALRGLVRAGREVASGLRAADLAAARGAVGRHLVSRSTAALDEGRVASAAVESIAENFTDAVVAPCLFFLILGLPGAFAYRAVNTADAMIGYRHGVLEYFGKMAARLDDAMNLVPARLAGLAIVAAAFVTANGPDACRALARDRGQTSSPNAGWTMAPMAGALGVTLEKPGAYQLGDGSLPGAREIDVAIRVMVTASAIVIIVIAIVKSAICLL
jgi:adenosylcobinamide-phosphate synthase